MMSCNAEVTLRQDEMKEENPMVVLDTANKVNSVDHDSADGASLVEAMSLETDIYFQHPTDNSSSKVVLDAHCSEHPINNNSSDSVLTEAICSVASKSSRKKRKRKNRSSSLGADTCSMHPVVSNCSEAVVTEVQSNMESKHSKKKRNKRKKRKMIDNAQIDCLGKPSMIKHSSTDRDSCLESEVDTNTKADLKPTQLSELSSSHSRRMRKKQKLKEKLVQNQNASTINNKEQAPLEATKLELIEMAESTLTSEMQSISPRIESATSIEKHNTACKNGLVSIETESNETYERGEASKTYHIQRRNSHDSPENCVEPIVVARQTLLHQSNEVQSEILENKLEKIQGVEHAASVEVGEYVLVETTSNFSTGDFACEESKTAEIKHGADMDVSVKEVNVLEGSCLSLERPCTGLVNKKLLILDVNGLLADIVSYVPVGYKAELIVSRKSVFRRPFCDDFLQFCFEKFNVSVWSSRTKRNVDMLVDFLLGDSKHNLLFCWDQSHCTDTGFTTVENTSKPLLLKELKKIWGNLESDLPWNKGEYDESNTLLLDDSPYKALRNPVHTAIFPHSYRYKDVGDSSLGPGGDLRVYLERLAEAQNVQEFVAQNPFGQRAITESDPSWGFYRRIVSADSCQSQDVAGTLPSASCDYEE